MRLYLSSFRMGDHPDYLAALAGESGRSAVVIANALDDAPAGVRRSGVENELAGLAGLGFDADELDLRDYFGHEQRLRHDLGGIAMAWLRGGNVFMLRYALFRSGGDVIFRDLLAADMLIYAGYSAGACVLSPSNNLLKCAIKRVAPSRLRYCTASQEGLAAETPRLYTR
jgi:dipeptidase E